MRDKKTIILKTIKNFVLVLLGNGVLAFGSAVFIIPFNLISGGVTGLAIVIDNLLESSVFTTDVLIAILGWTLFFVGLIFLGRDFALKTLISALFYPFAVSFFTRLLENNFLGGILSLKIGEYSEISVVLASIFGGVLVGAGCALTFLGGGSTGGMDILAFLIVKFAKKLKSSVMIFVLDTAVILFGLVVFKNLTLTLLGIVTAFVSVLVIDKVFIGQGAVFSAQIITEKGLDISREIIQKLGRTTTQIAAIGGYTLADKNLVLVSFTLNQYADLISLVKSVDKNAFVILSRIHEINGQGF